MKVRLLIADDHQIVREGLRSLLEKQPGMEVIAEANNGRTAVDLVQKLAPDVAIMDLSMPDMNGIEATRAISSHPSKTRVIVLSMHSDRRFVSEVLKAGASGYLLKDAAFEELAHAIQTVLSNQIYLSPQIANVVLKDYVEHLRKDDSSVFSILTKRERQVLQMVAEGKMTKQIASELQISVKTVETHRARIMEKLQIDSLADLVKYAVREGLTSLEP